LIILPLFPGLAACASLPASVHSILFNPTAHQSCELLLLADLSLWLAIPNHHCAIQSDGSKLSACHVNYRENDIVIPIF
jgi:hypothetical protein